MKMVCIKKGAWIGNDGKHFTWSAPNFGEIVTVEKARPKSSIGPVYELAEYPHTTKEGIRVGYATKNFRPIIKDEPEAKSEKFDFRQHLKEDA